MRKVCFLLLFAFTCIQYTSGQEADNHIANLINEEKWFELMHDYPQLKDSMQSPFMGVLAETMIDIHTNRTADAVKNIDLMFNNYQSDLGQSIFSFIALRAQLLVKLGRYADAADFLRGALDQFKNQGVTKGLESMERYWKSINSIRSYPPMSISRPAVDYHMKFTLQELHPNQIEPWMKSRKEKTPEYKPLAIMVPAVLHGEKAQFVFDTGAGATFLTEKFARSKGLALIGDSITMNGTQKGLRTCIDSLQIGDITIRNIIAYVGLDDNNKIFDLIGLDAILGRDVMAAIGEIQINMSDSTLVFPVQSTEMPQSGSNMLDNAFVKANYSGNQLPFLFDTGNSDNTDCNLYTPFYKRYEQFVNANASTDSISGGGYAYAKTKEVKIIPNINLSIDNHIIRFKAGILEPDDEQGLYNCYGNIGIAAVLQNKKTIINFKDMFLKFE